MAFVEEIDYLKLIKEDVLDEITEEQDSYRIDAEAAATEEMKGYLRPNFNVAVIFAKTGSGRNSLLVMYLCDMVLYHLHSRINPHSIPELRKNRYDRAIQWLKDVAKGLIDPGLPRTENEEGDVETGSRYGSNPKLTGPW